MKRLKITELILESFELKNKLEQLKEKQMSKDDIDVFHCDCYGYDKECSAGYSLSCGEIEEFERCEDLPNCYYKQLQRKIKECEKLKKSLRWIRDYRIDEIGYYDEEDAIIKEVDKMLEKEDGN